MANPLVAGIICSFLILPARVVGREVAQAFRRSVDYVISNNDTLFELMVRSHTAADATRSGQAWATWIIYGMITAITAMLITRWLAAHPLTWPTVILPVVLWIAVYLLIWNWDTDLQFSLDGSQAVIPGQNWGPWPYAGFFGFFSGLITGLILSATPWRVRT